MLQVLIIYFRGHFCFSWARVWLRFEYGLAAESIGIKKSLMISMEMHKLTGTGTVKLNSKLINHLKLLHI